VNTLKLKHSIYTDFSGYKQLASFYHTATNYADTQIEICFRDLEWFDANLSSLLHAMLHKLNKERGLTFVTNTDIIHDRFDVLCRNGFINTGRAVKDVRNSTLPNHQFDPSDKHGFVSYVERYLLDHRGMPRLTADLHNQILDDMIELYSNINYHSNTTDPCFVCGQYYPTQGFLVFTLTDLGDGFLPKIQRKTNGAVNTSLDAIHWALKGNSTKEGAPGGLGLKNMYQYLKQNKGILQVVTGNGYWGNDMENTFFNEGRILPEAFTGTTINLFFKHK
jgi:hypothetical protein